MLDGFVRKPDFPIFAGNPDFSPIFWVFIFACTIADVIKKCFCHQKFILALTMLYGFVTNPDFPIFAGITDFSLIF